jgi:hypothetical protein
MISLSLAGPQEVEELVDDEQQAVVGERRLERGHHLLQRLLVVRDLV